ncbi:hypothetical protein ABUW04_33455 [Streptacidiphilus sp. N1-10]|uniref:DUF5655 domain-containing protein n=1 Tax=Streptacidiphilus jeojiensis TaxID=3229225 RepID=A0ABV6XY13_9ACTN
MEEAEVATLAERLRDHWDRLGATEQAWLTNVWPGCAPDDRLPGLVCVSMERKAKWVDACWIGVVLGLGHRSLRLHELNPQARWHRRPSKFRLDAITTVSFGGSYERILEEFAGERPEPDVQ